MDRPHENGVKKIRTLPTKIHHCPSKLVRLEVWWILGIGTDF